MKNLKTFVNNHNIRAILFGKPKLVIDSINQTIANQLFEELDGEMSPENLCCDGEISIAQAQKKAKHFRAVAAELESMGFKRPNNLHCI